jgi:hypothetical protein
MLRSQVLLSNNWPEYGFAINGRIDGFVASGNIAALEPPPARVRCFAGIGSHRQRADPGMGA